MHIEHVDAAIVGERRKADGFAAKRGDEGEFARQPRAEFLLVVSGRGPGFLLRG